MPTDDARDTYPTKYHAFIAGMEAAAEICGSLAETTYDDADAFEAATGCEASIMRVVREQKSALANPGASSGKENVLSEKAGLHAETIEACARVADKVAHRPIEGPEHSVWHRAERAIAKHLATAIRALSHPGVQAGGSEGVGK